MGAAKQKAVGPSDKGRSWMSAEQEGKPPGLDLALIFFLNSPELGYSLSTFHGTPYCTPSPESCAFTPRLARALCLSGMWIVESLRKWKAWLDACQEESSPTGAIAMQDSVLHPSTILAWISFFPGSRLCGQLAPRLHGKQTHCRVGCCFTGEVCHIWDSLTDTKFNKSRSGWRESSSCCTGWDCQLRSFWIQKQVCVPANKRGMGLLAVKANLPFNHWNVLVLETTLKRV